MPLQGIANSGFAAATRFGMLVGETHAGAVVVELGRACGKQGRSGQRQRRFWQSLGNHRQWIYNMLRDESAVAADLCCCSRRVVFGIALYRCSRRKVLSVDLGCCSRSVEDPRPAVRRCRRGHPLGERALPSRAAERDRYLFHWKPLAAWCFGDNFANGQAVVYGCGTQ